MPGRRHWFAMGHPLDDVNRLTYASGAHSIPLRLRPAQVFERAPVQPVPLLVVQDCWHSPLKWALALCPYHRRYGIEQGNYPVLYVLRHMVAPVRALWVQLHRRLRFFPLQQLKPAAQCVKHLDVGLQSKRACLSRFFRLVPQHRAHDLALVQKRRKEFTPCVVKLALVCTLCFEIFPLFAHLLFHQLDRFG